MNINILTVEFKTANKTDKHIENKKIRTFISAQALFMKSVSAQKKS